jgi:hypothetical protein
MVTTGAETGAGNEACVRSFEKHGLLIARAFCSQLRSASFCKKKT